MKRVKKMEKDRQYSLDDYKLDVVRVKLIKDRTIISDTPITTPQDAVDFIGRELAGWDREAIMIFNLDTKNKVINLNLASVGTINVSITSMREILKSSILSNSNSIIMMHNHPSGDPTPSQEDIELTEKLVAVGELVGIGVLDHIIVGEGGTYNYFSFRENDMLHPSKQIFQIIDDTHTKKRAAVAEKKTVRRRRK